MSKTEPRPLIIMQQLAQEVIHLLRPHYARIHVAGSIRREQPGCADIEIVCSPLWERGKS